MLSVLLLFSLKLMQRRIIEEIPDFPNKTWEEFADGFGSINGAFWLGNLQTTFFFFHCGKNSIL